MKGLGISIADVGAICLTHLDHDHFNANWVREIIHGRICIFCHQNCVPEISRRVDEAQFIELLQPFNGQIFSPISGLSARAIELPHDVAGSHGFLFEGFGSRLGYATDLGRVEMELIQNFSALDLLAIESNYDPAMQRDSARPWFLKNRIMGGRGHLSNAQAFDAVRLILDRCEREAGRLPGHIVLLHRSGQCNSPRLVRELFSRDARIAPRLVLAEQDRRTDWLHAKPAPNLVGSQLELQWG
jgi:phosphoribosyl 1,2-cyclic phosphodiesterase